MPVPGRTPKPAGQAVNRNKPTTEWVEVLNVPYAGARPDLPATRTVIGQFGPVEVELKGITRDWWDTISSMPHCILWAGSDWVFALATALVADAAFTGGIGAATELRNREKILGATVDFRRSLRIRYVDQPAETGDDAEVFDIDTYRDL
jgi:hypothetical protein